MKKFIILTLMCALLAGAAFAQGWSVSGQGELGAMLNFAADKEALNETKVYNEDDGDILPGNSVTPILIGANSYHNIEYYGFIGAQLGIRYNNGGLSTGFDFYSKKAGNSIVGVINYASPIAAFGFENNITDVLNGGQITNNGRLWGYYKFLDGMIHLEAAAKSADNNFWGGSTVVSDIFNGLINAVAPGEDRLYESGKDYFNLAFGKGFTDADKHNYLLVNVAPIDGLEVGLMFPGVFAFGGSTGGGAGGLTQTGTSNAGIPGYINLQPQNQHVDFVNDTLLHTRLGAKYSSGPINVAFQFALLGTEQKMKVINTGSWDTNKNGKLDTGESKDTYKDTKGKALPDLKKVVPETRKVKPAAGDDVEIEDIYTAIPGLYLGASYAINDMISAQLGFQGEFYSQTPRLGVGLGVNLGMGKLNAGLAFGLHTEINPDQSIVYHTAKEEYAPNDPDKKPYKDSIGGSQGDKYYREYTYWKMTQTQSREDETWEVVDSSESWFGIKPSVSYTIVENYLAASLNANLWFAVDQARLHDNSWQAGVIAYEVTPELFFNVAGTGAATNYYGGLNTAIIVRYKIAGYADGSDLAAYKKQFQPYKDVNDGDYFTRPAYNGLDITFKWAF